MDRRDLLHFTAGGFVVLGIFLTIELADEQASRRPGPWAHLLIPKEEQPTPHVCQHCDQPLPV